MMKESKLGVKLISLFKPARITLCLNLAPVLVKKLMFLKGVNEGNTFGWFYTLRHFASTKIAGIYKKNLQSIFVSKWYVFWDKPSWSYGIDAILTVFEVELYSMVLYKLVFILRFSHTIVILALREILF